MGEGEPSRRPEEHEVSPINPAAHRVPGGVWNADELPVLDWEIAERRVIMPRDLQAAVACPVPVLRWPAIKYRSIMVSHQRDRHVVENLTRYLEHWVWVGEETGRNAGQHRVLIVDESGRWYAVTIGPDRNESHNIITVFGGSDRGFLRNRLRHLENLLRREK